ncbi:hypothetical protein GIB67_000484 [Kingdonia uniflora]|uniref:Arginine decarboxylase n=1 Tax=Kingdonia uniflora TaxID=39325 RepID=A0A7J7L0C6_9MAGN|nr:hypothetical protein GIB67_000484 [Kingdonia uniflora]
MLIFEAVSASVAKNLTTDFVPFDFVEGLTGEVKADYMNLNSAAIRGEYQDCIHYEDQLKGRCVEQFKEGALGLEQLAAVDSLCELVANATGVSNNVKTYHVNPSVFTSVPDFWGIGRSFPILPIHKLDQKPGVKGILSDLTCDSDGKIDKFINGESSLQLHELESG